MQPVKIKGAAFLRPFLGGTTMAKAKKLPSGKWRALVYDYTDSNGKRKYKSFTAETKKEAEFLAADYSLNKKSRSSTSDMTLYEGYTRYIKSKSNILSPSTIRGYVQMQKNSYPSLMDCKIKSLTQEKIQIAVNEDAAKFSSKTVRNRHGLLSAVLAVYYPSFKIDTTLPQKVKVNVYIPDDDIVKQLLDMSRGTPLHKAILLASVGTLRRSEICALYDTDLIGNFVRVDKSLVQDKNGSWTISKTKTTESTRDVELPPEIMEILRKDLKPGEKVVPLLPDSITKGIYTLRKKITDKPFNIHKLRHYAASILHALDVPDKYIMERGGWTSRETLDRIYTHTLDSHKEKLNQKINKHFSNFK